MHSIRTKILTIVLAFFALNTAALVFYSIVTTRNYKGLRLDGIEKTAAFEAEQLNKEFAKMERSAIDLANSGLLYYYLSQSEQTRENFLLKYLLGFPAAAGAGFWFEQHTGEDSFFPPALYGYFDKAEGEVRLDDMEAGYEYHNQSWYRDVIGNIREPYQVVWVKPYIDDTSYSLMTTAGAGIFDNGRLIGISIIDWEIEKLLEELQKVKPTENSSIVLYDPEHDYIVSATHESGADASIKDFPWGLDSTSFILEGPGYWEFGRFIDNGWFLKIRIPENEIFADVEKQNSRFSLYIALSSVVLLGLGYYLVSKLVNAPIKQLTTDVSQLALGNLDVQIDLPSKDELGMLARTFNKMTADLKSSIEDNARQREEKERIRTELSVATGIQTSMLPCIFPPFPEMAEFDLYASMLPAKEVGGDFYDFFLVDKNTLAVVIADVSGKGVPAALFMVIAKTLIKNNANSGRKTPKEVFETVNNMLCESNDASMFVTAFMGYYNIPTGRFVFVNAGHNPPLLKKAGGSYGFLRTKPNIILGYIEDTAYTENEIILEPGSVLYLYTDGVTEAMNPELDMFSDEGLLAALNQNKDCLPEELLRAVKRDVDAFAGGAEQADDITMLALRVNIAQSSHPEQHGRKIELVAKIENLEPLLNFVEGELKQHHCHEELQKDFSLAVEEVFMNIANYAYSPGYGSASVCVSAGKENGISIAFEDSGKAYNPLEQADPDIDAPLEEREIGGLGVFLVKKLMDKAEYQRTEGRNIFTITKFIP